MANYRLQFNSSEMGWWERVVFEGLFMFHYILVASMPDIENLSK